ncbi:MAG: ATP-binding cassette domain-containing protein [Planctomycetota bacterium]
MSLRLHDISKTFGRFRALDGVSLHVRKGDCYGFLGHNGAGKTTALRIALGLIPADRGRVYVDGFDAGRHVREARARQGGLIERPGFYGWLSGRRNLVILGKLAGIGRDRVGSEADRLLEVVGLSSAGDRAVGGYSQGMRQRLGIAQALLGDPAYVLLDEPMNGLDPEGIEEFRRLIVRLTREEGKTVVFSSHQLHEIAGICNRIGILRQGKLLVEATTDELLAGGENRYRLRTDDDERASELLREIGIDVTADAGGGLLFDVGENEPGEVAARIVGGQVTLTEISPRTATLEEIYLRFSRDGVEAAKAGAPPAPVEPADRRAPKFPVLRTVRAETQRLLSHAGPLFALALPVVLAVLAVFNLHAEEVLNAAKVEAGELYDHAAVTAFEGVAVGLRSALPLLALVVAGIASQSIAGEYSRGTLRNLLLTPLGRVRLAVGKALGLLGVATVAYVFLAAATLGLASSWFDFTDVTMQLMIKDAEPYVISEAKVLWGPLNAMVPALVLPVLAWAGIGFFAGAITKRGVTALALTAGLFVFLDLLRVVGRTYGFEPYLISAHLPSPLGDTSYTEHLLNLIRSPNDPPGGYTGVAWLAVPLAWLVVPFALGAVALRRRSVP